MEFQFLSFVPLWSSARLGRNSSWPRVCSGKVETKNTTVSRSTQCCREQNSSSAKTSDHGCSNVCKRSNQHHVSRRDYLQKTLGSIMGVAFAAFHLTSSPAQASELPADFSWKPEELCSQCSGKGTVTCGFCQGSGQFALGDSMVERVLPCPNCGGNGFLVCPRCIGLGLADVKGILRDGQNDGRLKVLPNGSVKILQCEAFPSCTLTQLGN